MRTNRISAARISKTIGDMKVGDSGYTTHWAVSVDKSGKGAIRLDYTIHDRPGGTVAMLVTKEQGGYVVTPDGSYEWSADETLLGVPVCFEVPRSSISEPTLLIAEFCEDQ